ncbi:DarT1-associated NADAR antitoxin family protein [Bacillus sp. JJ722]|uniref:DarT1-associated NADAR antitoxin family protein n=1 Tax=Bacillus sp. JJ722 TaxID=3122973 RepID=UPI002FFE86C8
MAERPVFISSGKEKGFVSTNDIEFEWFPGFSMKQKQRSIESFHQNFKIIYPSANVLEVSSKSDKELGVSLSAFNLMIKTKNNKKFSVETAFQASKVFEFGGPFVDLYEKSSKEAKKDPRIKDSGRLLYFRFFGRKWNLEPKTFFYDWLYINALALNTELSEKVVQFNAFTDIEFNPQKSINCQARSVALYVSLYRAGMLEDALSSAGRFKEIVFGQQSINYSENEDVDKNEQLSIFDKMD